MLVKCTFMKWAKYSNKWFLGLKKTTCPFLHHSQDMFNYLYFLHLSFLWVCSDNGIYADLHLSIILYPRDEIKQTHSFGIRRSHMLWWNYHNLLWVRSRPTRYCNQILIFVLNIGLLLSGYFLNFFFDEKNVLRIFIKCLDFKI